MRLWRLPFGAVLFWHLFALSQTEPRIHLGTGINSPSTAPVVLRALQTLNYVVLQRTVARFSFGSVHLIENRLSVGALFANNIMFN